jgi:hypothetical protein
MGNNILNEILKFLFTASIIYIIYVMGSLIIKAYAMFSNNEKTRFILTPVEKVLLWISLSMIVTYLF